MATNSSRGNTIAAADGPPKETPMPVPPVPGDVKAAITHRHDHRQQEPQTGSDDNGNGDANETAEAESGSGLHAPGQDAGSVAAGAYVKTVGEMHDPAVAVAAGGGGREKVAKGER